MKIGMELKMIESQLMSNTRMKFRNIMGHSKDEVRPGVLAEDGKFVLNLQKRIILPSQRITLCEEGAKALHEQADKFGDYMSLMKQVGKTKRRYTQR